MGPYYPSARFASHGRDFYIDGVPVPTHEDAIAAIPGVINAARCLEGLPVISLPDGLPDGYTLEPDGQFTKLMRPDGKCEMMIPTNPDNIAWMHLRAWHLALSPATAAPARELTDGDLPEGYGVSGVASAFMFCRCGVWSMMYPTRPAAIAAAIHHEKVWKGADRG
jgi:hypothetical protein